MDEYEVDMKLLKSEFLHYVKSIQEESEKELDQFVDGFEKGFSKAHEDSKTWTLPKDIDISMDYFAPHKWMMQTPAMPDMHWDFKTDFKTGWEYDFNMNLF